METQDSRDNSEVEKPEDSGLTLVLNQTTCVRCGGLMVTEFWLYYIGKLSSLARRCVQCGDLVDPIILKNRCNPAASVEQEQKNPRAPARR